MPPVIYGEIFITYQISLPTCASHGSFKTDFTRFLCGYRLVFAHNAPRFVRSTLRCVLNGFLHSTILYINRVTHEIRSPYGVSACSGIKRLPIAPLAIVPYSVHVHWMALSRGVAFRGISSYSCALLSQLILENCRFRMTRPVYT